ncbi:hypothetical protein OC846_006229 [Tilletia horrida]|uniref:Amine oxidase domain-containing protein n=1 Tax=Tilletia horrida TaxID=155126 RepID=A0AAN6GLE9_9BASI|nr:hypothetical protein OC846_006229 [Tilletia horrida]KAK0559458.1 hypothetical protein OC861_006639 [Tilletia horrida]
MPLRIAVVGAGVSGLGATWALNEHSPHDVYLFEAGDYVGGHTHTVEFEPPQDQPGGSRFAKTWVDTGFIVFNEVTYPNFLRFIKHIGIRIIESDMSFAVTRTAPPSTPYSKALFSPRPTSSSPSATKPESPLTADAAALRGSNGSASGPQGTPIHGQFEWAGTNPIALFCQWTNLLDPNHWRMVWDIIRFNYQSIQTLREEDARRASDRAKAGSREESIGEWVRKRGYGDAFIKNYLIPMTSSIWSTPPTTALSDFPALTLLRFCHNHHLLQILNRPRWLTLHQGSHNYVQHVISRLPAGRLHTGPSAGKIVRAERRRTGAGVEWVLSSQDGAEHVFDRVIFATHANTSLDILNDQLESDDVLRTALSGFLYSKNRAVLHADTSLMPVRKQAWAAWNFLAYASDSTGRIGPTKPAPIADADVDQVSLTYWMNLLQSLPISRHGPVLVTLNPPQEPSPYAPAPELTVGAWEYEHPVYSARTVASQNKLAELQGSRGLYFAGAWIRYGFHEDGFSAGLRAAEWCAASERSDSSSSANGQANGSSVHSSQHSIDEDGPLGLTNGNGSRDPLVRLPFEPRADAERAVPVATLPELILGHVFALVEFFRRNVFGPAFLAPILLLAIWANLALESALNLVLVLLGKGVIDVDRHVRGSAIRSALREVRAGWEKAREQSWDRTDAIAGQAWTAGRA